MIDERGDGESEPTDCISGPVETSGDLLVLRIPLAAGGSKFVAVTTKIGSVQGDVLEIRIPVWMAQKLEIGNGDIVTVGLQDGKFTMCPNR